MRSRIARRNDRREHRPQPFQDPSEGHSQEAMHVIDYVVIHELAHVLERNHSPLFWQHVKTPTPNFEACPSLQRSRSILSILSTSSFASRQSDPEPLIHWQRIVGPRRARRQKEVMANDTDGDQTRSSHPARSPLAGVQSGSTSQGVKSPRSFSVAKPFSVMKIAPNLCCRTNLCLANSYYVYKSPLFHRLANPGGNGTIGANA